VPRFAWTGLCELFQVGHLTHLLRVLPPVRTGGRGTDYPHCSLQPWTLGSANSGVVALFDALNVVYDEREKRSLVRLYATTFLFTLAGIVIVIVAITGVIVLPVMLKFVGLSTTTEWLVAILRWPVLLVTIVVGLACMYRYGPSRRDARWRWVTWGSILAALLWMASSMLFLFGKKQSKRAGRLNRFLSDPVSASLSN
jgi:Virulence factor BrkB